MILLVGDDNLQPVYRHPHMARWKNVCQDSTVLRTDALAHRRSTVLSRLPAGCCISGNHLSPSPAVPRQVRKLTPGHMRQRGVGPFHVTCAMFSRDGEVAATYNDEVCVPMRR